MRERQDVVLKGTTKKQNMTGHELILEPHRKNNENCQCNLPLSTK